MGTSELLSVPFALVAENARALTLEDENGNLYQIGVNDSGDITAFLNELWLCGLPITDARNGKQYATIQIGDQCWMAENLNIGTQIDGSSDQTNNYSIEKYCYDDNIAQCNVYGGLYQWNEMMGYINIPGARGICPEGWHLPTDAEWTDLTNFLGDEDAAGGKMKETGTTHWNSPNTSATNSNGFTALPGGYRNYNGAFEYMGFYAYWWSSTEFSSTHAYDRHLFFNSANIYRTTNVYNFGFSVRCVMNDPSNPPSFNLNLEVSPSGAGTVSGEGQYQAGEEIAVSTTANQGWAFQYWECNDINGWALISEEAAFTYSMPGQDVKTLTAVFYEDIYCPNLLIDTRDGQEYATVKIFNQCWMAENLNIGTSINGNINQTNNNTIEKWCYNNSDDNCDEYGGLYHWDEMMGYTITPGEQGICPDGWHLPTNAEWNTLTISISGLFNLPGDKMKETGSTHWAPPNYATNSSGFTALPGGRHHPDGSFINKNYYGYWWSSSPYETSMAWSLSLWHNSDYAHHDYFNKSRGFSVRCIKNN